MKLSFGERVGRLVGVYEVTDKIKQQWPGKEGTRVDLPWYGPLNVDETGELVGKRVLFKKFSNGRMKVVRIE